MGVSVRSFVRIEQPNNDARIWTALASLAVVGAVLLLGPSIVWRRKGLGAYAPKDGPLVVKSWWNVPPAAVLLVAGLAGAVSYFAEGQYVAGIVLAVLWIGVTPSVVEILDCWTVAAAGAECTEHAPAPAGSIERERELLGFSSLHERFVAVAAIELTLFVLWLAADARLRTALRVADVARQGGSYLVDPSGTGFVVAVGLLLAMLLAVAYVPTAVQIRTLAAGHIDAALADADWTSDYAEAKKQRDARVTTMSLDQPLHRQFQRALTVAAPLLASLGTAYLSI